MIQLKLIAFLMPGVENKKPLKKFVVSVDEIEKMTGIDFFEKIENEKESKLEGEGITKNWKF